MGSRQELIRELEELRASRVIVYITGDRPPVAARIGEDAVRPIFDLLRQIGPVDRLDLFVYSRGGSTEVPWRIASAFRRFAKTWSILIPFRANSAATLLALGADEIILGQHGELGPIDPIINMQRISGRPDGTPVEDAINVEDVMSYLLFVREEVGLSDQAALAEGLGRLAERLDAVALGSVYRTRSHIREVALRMLTSQKAPPTERVMETIVDTLATRVYAHGHAIEYREAKDIGLSVVRADNAVEDVMWQLLCEYERDLKLREPFDPMAKADGSDRHVEDIAIAVLESADLLFEFRGQLDVRPQWQMPEKLQVNLNFQIPPGMDPTRLPDGVQELLQAVQEELQPHAYQAVQQALSAQVQVSGVEFAFRGGKWVSH